MDLGSQRSYITRTLAENLRLKILGKRPMTILTFGSVEEKHTNCELVRVTIIGVDNSRLEVKLLVVPVICEALVRPPVRNCVKAYPHLRELQLADTEEAGQFVPEVLIGADIYWELMTGEMIVIEEGPRAVHTKLGWVLSGPITTPGEQATCTLATHVLKVQAEVGLRSLERRLQGFWEVEALGIIDREEQVYEQFTDYIHLTQGRYEVSLPWKDPLVVLPSNYELCHRRLLSLLKKLQKDKETFQAYNAVIEEQLQKGIIEIVEHPEEAEGDRIHYLPHHAVIRKDKETTKLRIVYDASARNHGPSLNDCLHAGPKLQQRILDILLMFRTYRVAFAADIEKAFLNIAVAPEDRDVLRFLWVADLEEDPPNITIMRFTRVMFGISSSPFLLNATVRKHLENFLEVHPCVVTKILDSIYVDDVICGADDDGSAENVYLRGQQMLKEGGFNLHKFVTNSKELEDRVLSHVVAENQVGEQTYAHNTVGKAIEPGLGEHKVLGILWDVTEDSLVFKVKPWAEETKEIYPTKRKVISTVSKFFDPLGLLSPVIIPFKIFFQDLCRSKIGWDEPLQDKLLKTWNKLVKGLQLVDQIKVPRYYLAGSGDQECTFSLHGFCDASALAYAAVVYLVAQMESIRSTNLLASKTRVTPLQGETIPRLELLSATILARLIKTVKDALAKVITVNEIVCYTDSEITLHWVKGLDKSWKPFVQNRVQEIRKYVAAECWRHCPGSENPADIPSRGTTIYDLQTNRLWWNGPEWLGDLRETYELDKTMPKECQGELKSVERLTVTLLSKVNHNGIAQVMEIKDYGSLGRLFRVTELVLKFIERLRRATNEEIDGCRAQGEAMWIKVAQQSLTDHKGFKDWKTQFKLFADDRGIWRCRGRLENSHLNYEAKYPIFLPRDHRYTKLAILRAHNQVLHNGVQETINELRGKYWIVKGRSLIKQVLRSCRICQVLQAKPFQAPAPPLPPFRVQEAAPFSYTGVDFAGPVHIKWTTQDACTHKTWICLYTCCVTRAVHLDLVYDLSTKAFIRCYKRFAARRGMPKKIISDNGTTFKGASKVLRKVVQISEVKDYLSDNGTSWIFNMERAPWWGGLFERMIQSMKRCLRKAIGRAKLTQEELLTLLAETEAVLNSRPISYTQDFGAEEPLTPSHLLTGRRIRSSPDLLSYTKEEQLFKDNKEILDKRMKHLEKILAIYWKRWKTEYLAELRERHRALKTNNIQPSFVQRGEVVIIHEDNTPRNFWRLGRIEEVIPGRDGIVRGATVKIHAKEGKTKLLNRPIQRLYPLEIGSGDTRSGDTRSGDTRSGSRDTRSGSGDTRSGSGDTRSGSGDTRSGDTRSGSRDTRSGSGDTRSGDTRSGSGDTRSGSGDTRSGSGDTRSGDTRSGSGDARSGSGDTRSGDTRSGSGDTRSGSGDTRSGDTRSGSGDTHSGDTRSADTCSGSGDTRSGDTRSGSGDTRSGSGDTRSGDTRSGSGDTRSGDTRSGSGDTRSGIRRYSFRRHSFRIRRHSFRRHSFRIRRHLFRIRRYSFRRHSFRIRRYSFRRHLFRIRRHSFRIRRYSFRRHSFRIRRYSFRRHSFRRHSFRRHSIRIRRYSFRRHSFRIRRYSFRRHSFRIRRHSFRIRRYSFRRHSFRIRRYSFRIRRYSFRRHSFRIRRHSFRIRRHSFRIRRYSFRRHSFRRHSFRRHSFRRNPFSIQKQKDKAIERGS